MGSKEKPESLQAGQRIKVVNGPFHAKVYRSTFKMDVYCQAVEPVARRHDHCGRGKYRYRALIDAYLKRCGRSGLEQKADVPVINAIAGNPPARPAAHMSGHLP